MGGGASRENELKINVVVLFVQALKKKRKVSYQLSKKTLRMRKRRGGGGGKTTREERIACQLEKKKVVDLI